MEGNYQPIIVIVSIFIVIAYLLFSPPHESAPLKPWTPTFSSIEIMSAGGTGSVVTIYDTLIACPDTVTIKTATYYPRNNVTVYTITAYYRNSGTWIRYLNGIGSPVSYTCPKVELKFTLEGNVYVLIYNGTTFTPTATSKNGNDLTVYCTRGEETYTFILFSYR